MVIRKTTLALMGAALGALVFAGGAAAQLESESIIKYRQGAMKALGGHMGAMSQIVRGKVDYGDHLPEHARAAADLARRVAAMFPEGSDFGETDALMAVWDEPEKFEEAAQASADAAAAFAEAAEGGADRATLVKAFKDLGGSCKGCHEDFRRKD